MLYLKNNNIAWKHAIVIPILTLLALPIIVLDICVEFYHRTCFPLCKLPYIKRRAYIKIIDRGKLQYLSFWQKLYCMYCGYGNGVMGYWKAIAGATEQYWCGIKHKKEGGFIEPDHQKNFTDYGDENEFLKRYDNQKT